MASVPPLTRDTPLTRRQVREVLAVRRDAADWICDRVKPVCWHVPWRERPIRRWLWGDVLDFASQGGQVLPSDANSRRRLRRKAL